MSGAVPPPELLLAAFAGGAFGAAVGALPSFALAGAMVVAGELLSLLERATGAAVPVDVTGAVAFGPVLGPHVAFAGGAAAAAYAARRGHLESAAVAHPAREITRGLGSRPDVLAVGGVFGVVGHLTAVASGSLGLPVDPVALGVVASALAHRVAFGYSLLGATPRRWASPLAAVGDGGREAEAGGGGDDGGSQPDGGRAAEPWLPYQHRWRDVTALGLAVGVLGGYVAYVTGSAFLAFGVSVVPLALLCAGVPRVPVTHHMALPASTAVLASVDPAGPVTPAAVAAALPAGEALALGAAFGAAGGLLGEGAQRLLYAGAETHLDPPAASIVATSLLVGVLALAGVFPRSAWVPLP